MAQVLIPIVREREIGRERERVCVFHCVDVAFGALSGGTPKMKNGAPRDELKNGCGHFWDVP